MKVAHLKMGKLNYINLVNSLIKIKLYMKYMKLTHDKMYYFYKANVKTFVGLGRSYFR